MNKIIDIDFFIEDEKRRTEGRKEMSKLAVQSPYEGYTVSAVEVAKWFVNKGLIELKNQNEELDKLQRLLYFSQLISIVKYQNRIFVNNMYVNSDGTIIDGIEDFYKDMILEYKKGFFYANLRFNKFQEDVLNTTLCIFGNLTSNELSEINKLHESWKRAFKNSTFEVADNNMYKQVFMVDIDDILSYDLDGIKETLDAYEITKENAEDIKYIIIDDIKYYYNSSEINMSEDIISILKDFNGTDKSYSIYYDESAGLIIY